MVRSRLQALLGSFKQLDFALHFEPEAHLSLTLPAMATLGSPVFSPPLEKEKVTLIVCCVTFALLRLKNLATLG